MMSGACRLKANPATPFPTSRVREAPAWYPRLSARLCSRPVLETHQYRAAPSTPSRSHAKSTACFASAVGSRTPLAATASSCRAASARGPTAGLAPACLSNIEDATCLRRSTMRLAGAGADRAVCGEASVRKIAQREACESVVDSGCGACFSPAGATPEADCWLASMDWSDQRRHFRDRSDERSHRDNTALGGRSQGEAQMRAYLMRHYHRPPDLREFVTEFLGDALWLSRCRVTEGRRGRQGGKMVSH